MCLGRGPLSRTLDRVWFELGLQLWTGWKLTKAWETIKENTSSLPLPLTTHQLGVADRTALEPWG